MGAFATGFGKALPALEVPNCELEKLVMTDDEWIVTRTGISSRRVAVTETVLDLAVAASCEAMGIDPSSILYSFDGVESSGACNASIDPASIDLVVLTTITPDALVPCTASSLKKALGLSNAIAFDLNAACTGFIYGASVAESMMAASHAGASGVQARNRIDRTLVVSAERLTRLTDWQDRNTCVLFGDGAGAMVLEWSDDKPGILSTYLKNDDDSNSLAIKMSYSSLQPFDPNGVVFDEEAKARHDAEHPDPKSVDYSYITSLGVSEDPASGRIYQYLELEDKTLRGGPDQSIYMNGQAVFKFAARAMESAVRCAVEEAGLTMEDVDFIIPHQANLRIIEFAAKRLGLPLEKFQVSISTTGNTSSSGVPMALTDAIVSGAVESGDIVVLVAFGGGLTSGAIAMEV